MIKYSFLSLSLLFIISCGNSNRSNFESSELARNISDKVWCLNDSFSSYLEDDLNEEFPLTDTFEFRSNGEVIYTSLYKHSNEINQVVTGSWFAQGNELTLTGNGETDALSASSDGSQLEIYYTQPSSEIIAEVYFDCTQ